MFGRKHLVMRSFAFFYCFLFVRFHYFGALGITKGCSIKLYVNVCFSLPYSLSSIVMCSLVQVVSVRRSLFDVAERDEFLNNLIKGVTAVLKNPQVTNNVQFSLNSVMDWVGA